MCPKLYEDPVCTSCEKEARDNDTLLREAVSQSTIALSGRARRRRRKHVRDAAWQHLRDQAALGGRM